jgi:aspartate/methionine/tyrosine aminotransferase
VLLVNAPNNPTGWTLTRDEQQAMLDALPSHRHLDRGRRGLRARCATGAGACAVVPGRGRTRRPVGRVAHSFSKSFLMTGLASGLAGAALRGAGQASGRGRQAASSSTRSCAPVFVQRGGLAGAGAWPITLVSAW